MLRGVSAKHTILLLLTVISGDGKSIYTITLKLNEEEKKAFWMTDRQRQFNRYVKTHTTLIILCFSWENIQRHWRLIYCMNIAWFEFVKSIECIAWISHFYSFLQRWWTGNPLQERRLKEIRIFLKLFHFLLQKIKSPNQTIDEANWFHEINPL